MFLRHKLSWITLLIIFCLYLFFPSGLSSTDGWYYAASIKHGGEIFLPHHLLYNALGFVFTWVPSKAGLEIISSLKIMNAFFAFLTLIMIQQILFFFRLNEKQVVLISCLAGFSFSLLRYATENETYIVPLFFALLASFNYIKFIKERRNRHAFYTGLWVTIAVLFHQIYIFWWAGLLVGVIIEKRKKPAYLYLIISLVAPVIYLIVFMTNKEGTESNTLIDFILGDLRENSRLELTGKGIFLSLVNLIRSFIQVHGYIFHMVRTNLLFLLPGIVSLLFAVTAFLKYPERSKTNISQNFSAIHILIVVLQFIFASFSSGNAEFMVMIPVLVFILFPFYIINYEKFLLRIMIAMAIWNISYGLIPLHYKSQAQEQYLCDIALSEKNIIIVASDDQLLKNMLYYQTGDENFKSILKSPAVLEIKGKDPAILEGVIDSALNTGTEIYTDCLDELALSRSSIMEGTKNRDFFSRYETVLIKSWMLFTGTKSIYRIKEKSKTST
jgi:hypothetical protein